MLSCRYRRGHWETLKAVRKQHLSKKLLFRKLKVCWFSCVLLWKREGGGKGKAKVRVTADCKNSLEASLVEGSTKAEMAKCTTTGPLEAGKTQLKTVFIGIFNHSNGSIPCPQGLKQSSSVTSTGAEAVTQRYVHCKSTWETPTRERLHKFHHANMKKTFTNLNHIQHCRQIQLHRAMMSQR